MFLNGDNGNEFRGAAPIPLSPQPIGCTMDDDADGICDDVDGCVDNWMNAESGGGSGIPEGDCDCDGNVIDAIGICGGDCLADYDADGICDDSDPRDALTPWHAIADGCIRGRWLMRFRRRRVGLRRKLFGG